MGIFNRKRGVKESGGQAYEQRNDSNGLLKSPSASRATFPLTPSMPEIALPRPPDPEVDASGYLMSIQSVRERTALVYAKAKNNQLEHFSVDWSKFRETAQFIVSIIKRDYAPQYSEIPPHGRWQHFEVGGRPRVEQLLALWPTVDPPEKTRRLIDLFMVSVLLDAGAGMQWQYRSKENGRFYRRSEGLAVASLEMFKTGMFSGNATQPHQVDKTGLRRITTQTMAQAFQVSQSNPMDGLEGRTGLLTRLADALENQDVFGVDGRPGNMLDYLLSHPSTKASSVPIITIPTLWAVLMENLSGIWPPSRTQVDGISIGDAWPCRAMPAGPRGYSWEKIVPFHKLTQWLTYSLMVPMTKLLHVHFAGTDLLTGLPEYRNGGLLVDTGLLTLRPEDARRGLENYQSNAQLAGQPNVEVVPLFDVYDDVIIEWRAVTIGFLDDLLVEVNQLLGLSKADGLSLAQMLEAGSWKGGREIAEVSRPNTKEPPILIVSDGTVF